ncbi:MAG: hypothetical protein IKX04_09085, partial [Clostridiales bacterium]|nr:hypothetical protein [Clostridiales bacterium]
HEGEIIELGVAHNIVEKSGSWYAYQGQKIGQGKDNAREFLKKKMSPIVLIVISAGLGILAYGV